MALDFGYSGTGGVLRQVAGDAARRKDEQNKMLMELMLKGHELTPDVQQGRQQAAQSMMSGFKRPEALHPSQFQTTDVHPAVAAMNQIRAKDEGELERLRLTESGLGTRQQTDLDWRGGENRTAEEWQSYENEQNRRHSTSERRETEDFQGDQTFLDRDNRNREAERGREHESTELRLGREHDIARDEQAGVNARRISYQEWKQQGDLLDQQHDQNLNLTEIEFQNNYVMQERMFDRTGDLQINAQAHKFVMGELDRTLQELLADKRNASEIRQADITAASYANTAEITAKGKMDLAVMQFTNSMQAELAKSIMEAASKGGVPTSDERMEAAMRIAEIDLLIEGLSFWGTHDDETRLNALRDHFSSISTGTRPSTAGAQSARAAVIQIQENMLLSRPALSGINSGAGVEDGDPLSTETDAALVEVFKKGDPLDQSEKEGQRRTAPGTSIMNLFNPRSW